MNANLHPCPDCAATASINAVACAHCGAPLRRYRQNARASDALHRIGIWVRSVVRFFAGTFVGNTLLLAPVLWLALGFLAVKGERFYYRYEDGASLTFDSVRQAWRYHSLSGHLFSLDPEAEKFEWDLDYRLPDEAEVELDGIDTEFYPLFVDTRSAQHFQHLLAVTKSLSRDHDGFHGHGLVANEAIAIVAALEAFLLAILGAALIMSVRSNGNGASAEGGRP